MNRPAVVLRTRRLTLCAVLVLAIGSAGPAVAAPTTPGFASIEVYKFLDPDGDLSTADGREVGGWEFSLDVTGGEVVYEEPVTGEGGDRALFDVRLDASPTTVLLFEEQQRGVEFEFHSATCVGQRPTEDGFEDVHQVGEQEEAGISFEPRDGYLYICTFLNLQRSAPAPSPHRTPPDTATSQPAGTFAPDGGLLALSLAVVGVVAGVTLLVRPVRRSIRSRP